MGCMAGEEGVDTCLLAGVRVHHPNQRQRQQEEQQEEEGRRCDQEAIGAPGATLLRPVLGQQRPDLGGKPGGSLRQRAASEERGAGGY